ncbi:DNA gyrase subunit A [Akkermansia sp. N21116]|jgi:DNA gyrase subunit A|uniref:DNA gyrase subunit A n=1 Tax=Akkermansia sp. N21116 TaxID=3040764 RepID=UPI00244E7CF6|nr:DNA gyrase subunit A [Akkermansia sp. N21116]WPX41300.1 DNA gyrase subunit A [Akkermansia sp. N21116]
MDTNRIKPVDVASELSTSFLDYSMSVIISRALPDVRDGLKPSQRRILYAMKELNLAPGGKTRKCSKIVGDTMGSYHPHGDAAIYGTLVNMAQNWSMRDILVIGQGNFGTPDGDPAAASRYTEAKLSGMGMAMMTDLDKDTVDFMPNYDGTTTEPTVFPSAFPNLLVNGGTGIAVGMATNMAPHNLGEVVDGICATIDNPHISVEELRQHIKGPDFPTGGDLLGFSGIDSYFRTGRGSVRIRGKIDIEQSDTGKDLLIIREVPYGVNRAVLQERIAELCKEKILTDISGLRDLSDEQTCIEIELKRDARPQVVVNQLYKLTSMETSFSVNMLAIHDNRPKTLTMLDAINFYIEHRREVIVRRTRHLLNEAEKDAERLEAFLLALGHMDDFIHIIRDSKNRDEARQRLQAYTFPIATAEGLGILIRSQPSVQNGLYVFTERQVNAILDLRLYQLTALESDKINNDYSELMVLIKDYLDILANESRVLGIVKDELQAIKTKYATPRVTRIIPFEGDMAIEDLIPNDSMIVTITHSGYIKRTNSAEYRVQARGGKGIKAATTKAAKKDQEADFIEHLFAAQNHDYIMFFTNTGRVYVDRVYEIDEAARSAQGRNIKNLLDLQPEENIAAILRLERQVDENGNDTTFGEESGFVVFATKDGTVKKTSLNDFRNYRKAGIIAINLEEGNSLVNAVLTSGNNEIVLVTHDGMSIRFNESDLRDQGRNTIGVRGIRPRPGDYVVALAIVDESATLLVASENGLGKRTGFDAYRLQSRGGTGVKTMNCTDKTGKVVSATVVSETDELMLMTTAGQSVRIKVETIRETGRVAQGVKLMTLKDGETIQDISIVIPDDDDETSEGTDEENVSENSETPESGDAATPEE